MIRLIILILTAHSRTGFQNLSRETWLKECPYDYRFVFGAGATRPPLPDELFTDAPDDYANLHQKDQAAFRWALERGYDHCLRCADDTVVFPSRIPDLTEYDYAGMLIGKPVDHPQMGRFAPWGQGYMHGGCGIWLSRKAMEKLVASNRVPPQPLLKDLYPDDIWMGEVLQGNLSWSDPKRNLYTYYLNNIRTKDDPRFFSWEDPKFPSVHPISSAITVHCQTVERMKRCLDSR